MEHAERAVALAEALLAEARAGQTAEERARAERLARLMDDPRGKELTIALTDQCFRSRRPERIADQLQYLLERYGAPRFMEWWERIGLTLGALMGQYLPSLVVPPIVARLRHETEALILPAEEEDLRRYLAERRAAGIRLNLNQLGEAILGEAEAARRLEAYLALLAREDVEYISVKISSVSSQIDLTAFRHTVEVVKERLRALYRQAQRHRYRHPDGRVTPKFVNLDMEEYRDLDITVAAFREVLDEPEFLTLPAGIVLQAYLPESHRVQRALVAWAAARCGRGGAPIKLRVVKGANLAMERIEADLHGWPQAPYTTKREVDANFKRMIEYGCRPEHAAAVHVGIASHNLFDVAYAMVLREEAGVQAWTEFEMLEGMANHQARAVQARAGGLLLYAPVVRAEDFHSAIAYLVRRLDENTASDNFLRHVFGLEPGSPEWTLERDRFLSAFHLPALSDGVRSCITTFSAGGVLSRSRDAAMRDVAVTGNVVLQDLTPFGNEADTDWTVGESREGLERVRGEWRERAVEVVPLQIAGEMVAGAGQMEGRDRSRLERVAYRHALADRAQVGHALDAARGAQAAWAARAAAERRGLIDSVARVLARRRGDLIGAMIVDSAKTVTEADPEVSEAIDFARYYARAIGAGDTVDGGRMEPLGVVVVAPPWNFPLSIPAGGVLAALAAGNAVLLKPAPEAVLVGWHLATALWDAGIPRALLQFVPCPDDDVGRGLVTDERVDGVILTGSVETARRFLEWRADLRLFAETSGKNAMIVTALADRDQAVRDLVRSAFGHAGQKCSAASLGICEAEVYHDPAFRRQLRDAAESLVVGSAWDPASRITPLTQPPGRALTRALTTLDAGEEWLLEPRRIEGSTPLWSPGIKLGVRRGSFFHRTECFGPVLGLMRAGDLDEAIDLANDQPFGLTAGLQSLDEREVVRWMEGIAAGNLYVNRSTTGAIVGRQPFGGWKGSSAGPGAKAGGPNYVLQLGHWRQIALPSAVAPLAPELEAALARSLDAMADDDSRAMLRASAASYAAAWRDHFGREHEPIALLGERNVFRYRRCRRVLVRAEAATAAGRLALAQVVLAARTCGVPVEISLAAERAGDPAGRDVAAAGLAPWASAGDEATVAVESEATLAARLASSGAERLRALTPLAPATRAAAHAAGVTVLDAPVLAAGRLELRAYLREQAVSRVVHRYGTVMDPADRPRPAA